MYEVKNSDKETGKNLEKKSLDSNVEMREVEDSFMQIARFEKKHEDYTIRDAEFKIYCQKVQELYGLIKIINDLEAIISWENKLNPIIRESFKKRADIFKTVYDQMTEDFKQYYDKVKRFNGRLIQSALLDEKIGRIIYTDDGRTFREGIQESLEKNSYFFIFNKAFLPTKHVLRDLEKIKTDDEEDLSNLLFENLTTLIKEFSPVIGKKNKKNTNHYNHLLKMFMDLKEKISEYNTQIEELSQLTPTLELKDLSIQIDS